MIVRITPEAAEYILTRATEVHFDLPPKIGCCIDLQEKPDIKIGPPQTKESFFAVESSGITVHVPKDFPTLELTITLSRFLAFRHLAVEGWHMA